MTDNQRRILQTVSDGDWHNLSLTFQRSAIAHTKAKGWIRQDMDGPIIGAMFTITPLGDEMIRGEA
jgi:hypothetical protein